MSTLSRFLARFHSTRPAAARPAMTMNSVRERKRFRDAMPGELGAREAVRLYGLGR